MLFTVIQSGSQKAVLMAAFAVFIIVVPLFSAIMHVKTRTFGTNPDSYGTNSIHS